MGRNRCPGPEPVPFRGTGFQRFFAPGTGAGDRQRHPRSARRGSCGWPPFPVGPVRPLHRRDRRSSAGSTGCPTTRSFPSWPTTRGGTGFPPVTAWPGSIRETRQVRTFDTLDGLPDNEVEVRPPARSPTGFSTSAADGGWCTFDPDAFREQHLRAPGRHHRHRPVRHLPPVGPSPPWRTAAPPGPSVELPHDQNDLSLSLRLPRFRPARPDPLPLHARGLDDDWRIPGPAAPGLLHQPEPETYMFRVRGHQPGRGLEPRMKRAWKSASCRPGGETWWAYSLYSLAVLPAGRGDLPPGDPRGSACGPSSTSSAPRRTSCRNSTS